MSENDKEQRKLLAKVAAVGLGAALGAFLGPGGAALGAVGALWVEENLLNTPDDGHPPGAGSHRWVVLALRATQFDSFHLSPKEKIGKDTCEFLYENSKYIWRGTQKEFEEKFGALRREKPQDESFNGEGAFRLVALEINEELPGLGRGADPLERRDAFRALAGKAKIVWVSHPLHFNSFPHKGDFYTV